jgi:hypothetical protein
MAAGYVAFSAENAAKGYLATRSVIMTTISKVRPKYPELAEWAAGAITRLPDVLPADIVTFERPDGARCEP